MKALRPQLRRVDALSVEQCRKLGETRRMIRLWTSTFGVLVALGPLAAPVAAGGNVRIAVVQSRDAPPFRAVRTGFERVLRQKGIAASYQIYPLDAEGNPPRSLLRSEAGLLLTLGPVAGRAASSQIHDVPIVGALIRRSDRVEATGNATGVLIDYPVDTQLRWMQRLLPKHRKVGVLFNPGENAERIDSANRAAKDLGMKLLAEEVYRPGDLPKGLREIARGADLIWGLADQMALTHQTAKKFIVFSFRNRIPLSGGTTSWVKSGALFSLERDYEDIGMQCGELAVKILAGASPASLPPTAPRRLLYSVNLKTARYMRVKLSDRVIQDAAYVFE
ncbi:MAG: ABC transporter substrate-binding protein [Gemmatimonadota bacterium]